MNGMYSLRKTTEHVSLKLKHSDRCGPTNVSLTSANKDKVL